MSQRQTGLVWVLWGIAYLVGCTPPAPAQTESTVAELDEFWRGVSRSVTEWSIDAQKATYHPDAISVQSKI